MPGKTKEQLLKENEALRRQIAELEERCMSPGGEGESNQTADGNLLESFLDLIEGFGYEIEIDEDGAWHLQIYSGPEMDLFGEDPKKLFCYEGLKKNVLPIDWPKVDDFIQRVKKEGKGGFCQFRLRRKNGEIYWVGNVSRVYHDPATGRMIRICGVASDATIRKKTEEELQTSRIKLDNLVAQSHDGILLTDEEGKIVTWNTSMERIMKMTFGEVKGRDVLDVLLPLVMPSTYSENLAKLRRAEFEKLFSQGQADFEDKILAREYSLPDGTYRILQEVWFAVESEKGYSVGAIVRDVTEQRWVEDAYRMLVENSLVEMLIVQDNRFVYANPQALAGEGYTLQEKLAMTHDEYFKSIHPDDRDMVMSNKDRRLVGEEASARYEIRVRRKDGKMRWLEIMPVLMMYQGKPAIQITQIDITERKEAEEALRTSEKKLQAVVENALDLIFIKDNDLRFILVNPKMANDYGLAADNFIGKTDKELFGEAYFARTAMSDRWVLRTGQSYKDIHRMEVEGEERIIQNIKAPIFDEARQVIGICSIGRDITDRVQSEEELRKSEERFRRLTENARDMIYRMSLPDGKYEYVSPSAYDVTGYHAAEYLADPMLIRKVIHPDWQLYFENEWQKLVEGEMPPVYEYKIRHKNGGDRWIYQRNVLVLGVDGKPVAIEGILTDVTAQREAELQLKASLQEKEVLLQEIHHRVKNNLQVISGLLDLQSEYIDDAQVLKIFGESQNRVRSIAMIHEKMYQADNLANIDFGEYVEDMAAHMYDVYDDGSGRVKIYIDAEAVSLDIQKAVPCGLIINELISNALKHAFPGEMGGEVWIEIKRQENGMIKLEVKDNGVGFPGDLDFYETSSLGLQLVNILVTQIEGKIALNANGGTRFTIEFMQL